MWWVECILNAIVAGVVIVAGWGSSSGSISGSSSEGLFIGSFCCPAGELFADIGKCVQQPWSMGAGEMWRKEGLGGQKVQRVAYGG